MTYPHYLKNYLAISGLVSGFLLSNLGQAQGLPEDMSGNAAPFRWTVPAIKEEPVDHSVAPTSVSRAADVFMAIKSEEGESLLQKKFSAHDFRVWKSLLKSQGWGLLESLLAHHRMDTPLRREGFSAEADIRDLMWDFLTHYGHWERGVPGHERTAADQMRYVLLMARMVVEGYTPTTREETVGTVYYLLERLIAETPREGVHRSASGHMLPIGRLHLHALIWQARLLIENPVVLEGYDRQQTLDRAEERLHAALRGEAKRSAYVYLAEIIAHQGHRPINALTGTRVNEVEAFERARAYYHAARDVLDGTILRRVSGVEVLPGIEGDSVGTGQSEARVVDSSVASETLKSARLVRQAFTPFLNSVEIRQRLQELEVTLESAVSPEAMGTNSDEALADNKEDASSVSTHPEPLHFVIRARARSDKMGEEAFAGPAMTTAPSRPGDVHRGTFRVRGISGRGNDCLFRALALGLGAPVTRVAITEHLRAEAHNADIRHQVADDILRVVADREEALLPGNVHLRALRGLQHDWYRRAEERNTVQAQLLAMPGMAGLQGRLDALDAEMGELMNRIRHDAEAVETYREFVERFVAPQRVTLNFQIELPTTQEERGVMAVIAQQHNANIEVYQYRDNGDLFLRTTVQVPGATRTVTLLHTYIGTEGHFSLLELNQHEAMADAVESMTSLSGRKRRASLSGDTVSGEEGEKLTISLARPRVKVSRRAGQQDKSRSLLELKGSIDGVSRSSQF